MAWVNKKIGKCKNNVWSVLGDSNSGVANAVPYHQRIKESTDITVFNYAQSGVG